MQANPMFCNGKHISDCLTQASSLSEIKVKGFNLHLIASYKFSKNRYHVLFDSVFITTKTKMSKPLLPSREFIDNIILKYFDFRCQEYSQIRGLHLIRKSLIHTLKLT